MKTILEKMYDVLNRDGTPVYFPEQSTKECTENYIVVKFDGTISSLTVSSERPIYTVMCYVPKNNYRTLENFIFETKKKMKELYPLLMYAGNETPSFYDDDVKAHMISFQYLNCRKIENF